jgi:phosphinothricin acetyltransferase
MKIQRCDRSFADPMLAILNEVIVNSTAIYDYAPRTPAMMQAWFDAKEKGNYPVIGLVDGDGTLAGFGTFGQFRNWPAYKYSVEHSIYVEKSFRGRGLGKIMLPAIIDAARDQQYHVMIGGIDGTNAASIALHEKFGFSKCAEIRQAGYKFGRWLDLVFYQLVLPTPEQPMEG